MIGILSLGLASIPADTIPTDWVYKYRFLHVGYPDYDTIGSFKFEEPVLYGEMMYQPYVNISEKDTFALIRKDGGKTYIMYEDQYFIPHFGFLHHSSTYGSWVEETDVEYLMYDFDVEAGGSFYGLMSEDFHAGWAEDIVVNQNDYIMVDGKKLRRQKLNGSERKVIENVGGGNWLVSLHRSFTLCMFSMG